MLLALDTSGAAITVAVLDGGLDDGIVLAERSLALTRQHAERLAPLIQQVMDDAGAGWADVQRIAVGVGPGPFTGLRVGLVTARVLGLARGLPVHGVCSLDALADDIAASLARDRSAAGEFLVATDARRREVYWAGYRAQAGRGVRVGEVAVDAPEDVPRRGRPVYGRGVVLYPEALGPVPSGMPLDVRAGAVGRIAVRALAEAGPGQEAALPPDAMYLRRPDAAPPGARKRVLR